MTIVIFFNLISYRGGARICPTTTKLLDGAFRGSATRSSDKSDGSCQKDGKLEIVACLRVTKIFGFFLEKKLEFLKNPEIQKNFVRGKLKKVEFLSQRIENFGISVE